MKQSLGQVALVVREYDEAIQFYVGKLGFTLVEDTCIPEQDKRWVIVAPPGSTESRLLLARATNEEQASRIGNQTGDTMWAESPKRIGDKKGVLANPHHPPPTWQHILSNQSRAARAARAVQPRPQ